MICPWLKKVTKGKSDWGETVTKESFLPCEGYECPYYTPQQRTESGWLIEEGCRRVNNGNDKG